MSYVFSTITDVRADVDRLSVKVDALESRLCRGIKATDKEFVTLTELLMVQLLKLDSIVAEGETKLQRKSEVIRVQSLLNKVDMLKETNTCRPIAESHKTDHLDSSQPRALQRSSKVSQDWEFFRKV